MTKRICAIIAALAICFCFSGCENGMMENGDDAKPMETNKFTITPTPISMPNTTAAP